MHQTHLDYRFIITKALAIRLDFLKVDFTDIMMGVKLNLRILNFGTRRRSEAKFRFTCARRALGIHRRRCLTGTRTGLEVLDKRIDSLLPVIETQPSSLQLVGVLTD
jgi:hypothetical protein